MPNRMNDDGMDGEAVVGGNDSTVERRSLFNKMGGTMAAFASLLVVWTIPSSFVHGSRRRLTPSLPCIEPLAQRSFIKISC